jgi:hypothetical protein
MSRSSRSSGDSSISLNRSKSSNPSINSNSKLTSHKSSSKTNVTKDPFRKAPLKVNKQQTNHQQSMQKFDSSSSTSSTTSTSSSSSSSCSISITGISKSSSAHSSPVLALNKATAAIGAGSAFQPYKRPPDPFASAPFDHVPNESTSFSTNNRAMSSSSSITPTDSHSSTHFQPNLTSSSKKKTTKHMKQTPKPSNLLDSNSSTATNKTNDDELIQVISEFQTPIVAKTAKDINQDPFMNAPFTVKKQQQLNKQSTLNSSTNSSKNGNFIPTSNSTSSILTLTSSFDNDNSKYINNSNSQFNNVNIAGKLFDSTDSSSITINSSSRMPQSQSLNEIKNNNSTNISDIIKPGGTSKLIKQYNLQYQQQQHQHHFAKHQQPNNNVNIFNNKNNNVVHKKNNETAGASNSGGGGIANMSFDDY